MTKVNKINTLVLLTIIGALILVQFLRKSNSSEKNRHFELHEINLNATRVESFREYFSHIDTPFYAYFRSKSGELFYNHLNEKKKGSFFDPKILDIDSIRKDLDFFNIKEVWQLTNENFFRLSIFEGSRQSYQILVAKKGESVLLLSKDYLSNLKVVNYTDDLANISDRPILIRVSNIIYILLHE